MASTGLTMRKLADRANVAVATLYNQFDDRSGVLVAFVSNGLDELEAKVDEAAGGGADRRRPGIMLEVLDQTLIADEGPCGVRCWRHPEDQPDGRPGMVGRRPTIHARRDRPRQGEGRGDVPLPSVTSSGSPDTFSSPVDGVASNAGRSGFIDWPTYRSSHQVWVSNSPWHRCSWIR